MVRKDAVKIIENRKNFHNLVMFIEHGEYYDDLLVNYKKYENKFDLE